MWPKFEHYLVTHLVFNITTTRVRLLLHQTLSFKEFSSNALEGLLPVGQYCVHCNNVISACNVIWDRARLLSERYLIGSGTRGNIPRSVVGPLDPRQ